MRIFCKRNVKRGTREILPSAQFLVLFGLLMGVSLGYVWLSSKCDLLGREIKKLEQQKTFLEKEYADELIRSEEKAGPDAIEDMMNKRGIVMVYPLREQLVKRQYVDRRKVVFDDNSAYVLNRTKSHENIVRE